MGRKKFPECTKQKVKQGLPISAQSVLHRNSQWEWSLEFGLYMGRGCVCAPVCLSVYLCADGRSPGPVWLRLYLYTIRTRSAVASNCRKFFVLPFPGPRVPPVLSEQYLGPVSIWIWRLRFLKVSKRNVQLGQEGKLWCNQSGLIYSLLAVSCRYLCLYTIRDILLNFII